MVTNRILLMFALLALVSMLIACGTSSQSSTPNPVPNNTNGGASTILDEIKGWFYNVAWSAAGVPIIGPLIIGILEKLKPAYYQERCKPLNLKILSQSPGKGVSGPRALDFA